MYLSISLFLSFLTVLAVKDVKLLLFFFVLTCFDFFLIFFYVSSIDIFSVATMRPIENIL